MAAELTPWPTVADILPADLIDTKKAGSADQIAWAWQPTSPETGSGTHTGCQGARQGSNSRADPVDLMPAASSAG